MEASCLSATGWHKSEQQGGPLASLLLYPLTLLSASWLPASLILAPNSQPDASTEAVSFQPCATGWLVEAGLLCAKSPHWYQGPCGGPLDIISATLAVPPLAAGMPTLHS